MSRKPSNVQRLVVKVGTSLVAREEGLLDLERLATLARELAQICRSGTEVILVSSGAIAAGMGELGWTKRPTDISKKQAAAAVGQPRLMESYRYFFLQEGISVAQLLLTREDFEKKDRRINAQRTLRALLTERVVPIINENDTVAIEEISVGDNDSLAALVAVTVQADLLVLLTDVEGLMTQHPHHGPGELIPVVERITPTLHAIAKGGPGSSRGTGGMITKLRAARYAVRHGVPMVIASGQRSGVLTALVAGQKVGTLFLPS